EHEQHVRAGREHQDRDQGQVGDQHLAADDPHAAPPRSPARVPLSEQPTQSNTIETIMLVFQRASRCRWMITLEPREDLDMELAEARALVKDKTDKDITVRHLISVEGVMRALAGHF